MENKLVIQNKYMVVCILLISLRRMVSTREINDFLRLIFHLKSKGLFITQDMIWRRQLFLSCFKNQILFQST